MRDVDALVDAAVVEAINAIRLEQTGRAYDILVKAVDDALESERSRADRLKKALDLARDILGNMCSNGVITTDPHSEGCLEYFVPTTIFEQLAEARTALGKEDVSD